MSNADNTLFLRLAGPMQSWGTSSRFQLRRTDAYPSKSGVLGMLLCAMGVHREDSRQKLEWLTPLVMGVRVDRSGSLDWDYHTAGAKIGIWQADRKKLKRTASTGEYETQLSRRQYLYDASFLVALHGLADTVSACAGALDSPIWPVFLGRKCCVPGEPVFVGTGSFDTMTDALSSVPWRPRIDAIDRKAWSATRTLDTFIEHPQGIPTPGDARLVHDVPRAFGFHSHGSRWVVAGQVTVPVAEATHKLVAEPFARRVDYTSPQWKAARASRLKLDHDLCVFCKSAAEHVHHVSYQNVGHETDSDLRSLCETCHDACTMLQYGHRMKTHTVDPSDPAQRPEILQQIKRLLAERRFGRRRELLKAARTASKSFFDIEPGVTPGKVQ
ncbi:type I-E CRISPR-associated protein Cas5/CasD [bacterium]|nr:type I-E CRISPR-associated protein Cas5/CasD [bacterium]